jgi:hypothetical protein
VIQLLVLGHPVLGPVMIMLRLTALAAPVARSDAT